MACPYADRRHGRPMNVAAARQVRGSWPEILRWLGGAAAQWPDTISGAWHATCACILAGPRGGEPIERALAALYKASLGLNQSVLQALLRMPVAGRPQADLGDGATFMAWCDREGMLLGRNEVCAGSPQQIASAWDAMLGRQGEAPPVPKEEVRAFALGQAADLVLMASTYQGLRRGEDRCDCEGCNMLRERPEAWMDCPPDRQPEQVLGLYEEAPEALRWLVEQMSGSHAERSAAWRRVRTGA